jgi:RNA polymerase sigma-70 factor (ECF subfamily)
MDASDQTDIQLSLRGDGEAFGRLVQRYQDEIARQMWRFTRDGLSREELVHDVFVEAYVSLRSFRGAGPFLHWLRKVATRVGYRYWKSQKRQDQHRVTLQDWDAVVDGRQDALERQQAAEMLEFLMGRLSPADRLVLTLLHLEELSVAEVARRTGWSQISVKVRAHRARKKLKALLEKMQSRSGERT